MLFIAHLCNHRRLIGDPQVPMTLEHPRCGFVAPGLILQRNFSRLGDSLALLLMLATRFLRLLRSILAWFIALRRSIHGFIPLLLIISLPQWYSWTETSLYTEDRGLPSTDDPGTWQFQIIMFRSIRVDHTNCLHVVIKTHSFILCTYCVSSFPSTRCFKM